MSESTQVSERAARAGANPAAGVGVPERGARSLAPSSRPETPAALMARVRAHLETTARTRSQLPPIQTNRRGLLGRFELWLKRRARSMTRWYAWEQVNFNSATHAALSDLFELVATFDERLKRLEQGRSEQHALASESFVPIVPAALQSPVEATSSPPQDASSLTAAEIRRLREEQRERIRVLLDEMRVAFKQLSLELSEAGVSDAPSGSVPRLDELERRIEEVRALCDRLGA